MKPTKLKQITKTKLKTFHDMFHVSWIVVCDEYDRYGGGDTKVLHYEGTLRKVLIAIMDNHGYGYDIDDEDHQNCSVQELINGIINSNGDGCDYITIIDQNDLCQVI